MLTAPGRLPFVADLADVGERLAVVDADGAHVGYPQLAEQVARARDRLGGGRRLVAVAAEPDLDTVVSYLAALDGGHPVLLTDPAALPGLVAAYDPDVVCGRTAGGWQIAQRRPGSAHDLHPDLALLLSTSGSTGSPKLVRLSAANLAANAEAIAGYLDIRPTDRAALTLPLHYCYGLSVLHSNLLRGAAVLLDGRSVTDAGFWTDFRARGATSLHGVPYTFELLDRVGFDAMELPSLRYVTQAGGRLDPATVARYAELGRRRGWDLVVMYGQTEATARMAYLPPEHAGTAPSTIGRPIPGGRFTIDETGELVYHGPNVMLGYAHGPADLALGATVDALRTGDLARRRPDGLYELVGRRSRFVKPYGLRVDLDAVERLLADTGRAAACTGSDDGLAVAVLGGNAGDAARIVSSRLGLPRCAVRAVAVDEVPRRPNGKLDHGAVAALAGAPPPPRATVRDAFTLVFPGAELTDDVTFAGLGGDSLSYVRMTVALQRALGTVPPDWPTTSLGELARLAPRTGGRTVVETAVALRAVAIVLVVGTHVGLFELLGGAHLLVAVAGWAFARFVLAAPRPSRAALRMMARVAVPSALWVAWRAYDQDDVFAVNALLVNYFVDPGRYAYWFVEDLAQFLLVLAAVLAIGWVRRRERAAPFAFALVVLAVALPGRLVPDPGNDFSTYLYSPFLVAWLFVLGWVVARADSPGRRAAAAVLVVALVPPFFADYPTRAVVVTAGLLLLLLVRGIALPGWAVAPVAALASASLAIYLTHYAVFPLLLEHVAPVAVVAACLAVGVAAQAAGMAAGRGVGRGLTVLRRRPASRRPVSVAAVPARLPGRT